MHLVADVWYWGLARPPAAEAYCEISGAGPDANHVYSSPYDSAYDSSATRSQPSRGATAHRPTRDGEDAGYENGAGNENGAGKSAISQVIAHNKAYSLYDNGDPRVGLGLVGSSVRYETSPLELRPHDESGSTLPSGGSVQSSSSGRVSYDSMRHRPYDPIGRVNTEQQRIDHNNERYASIDGLDALGMLPHFLERQKYR